MLLKEQLYNLLTEHGTTKTTELQKLTGLRSSSVHNALGLLLKDGLVTFEKHKRETYWTALSDDLEVKQIWGCYVPPKVTHTHHLMSCWY